MLRVVVVCDDNEVMATMAPDANGSRQIGGPLRELAVTTGPRPVLGPLV